MKDNSSFYTDTEKKHEGALIHPFDTSIQINR